MDHAAAWKWIFLRGLFGIGFGIAVLMVSVAELGRFVSLFAIFVFATSALYFMTAYDHSKDGRPWKVQAVTGVIGLLAGVICLAYPTIGRNALVAVMVLWGLASGVTELVFAVQDREVVPFPEVLSRSGFASIVFAGTVLASNVMIGDTFLIRTLGVYALASGFLFAELGWQMRRFAAHGGHADLESSRPSSPRPQEKPVLRGI